ncbi:TolC family protein [Alcanivorax sp. DP30]|uniref:TolC family protein n=1 Tax=Alcanivorax sp. DP30 TaxID=2606217 RepID=UPI001368BF24|nr:TolC family protein [Alcanivorax sp. DP30]MZR64379.1 TolC family protein [Alcanivorax sp. DP30]
MGSHHLVRVSVLLAVLCGGPQAAVAAPSAGADTTEWAQWVRQQVRQLPASRAITARQEQWLAESRKAEQPLYNPNLNIGYEDSVDVTQTVGLSQTLDWSGKARASRDVASLRTALADLRAQKARADLLAQSLSALIAYHAAQARLQAARQQEQQLMELADLMRRRQKAGDVGQVDARLSLLSVGQAQQALAEAEAASTRAQTRLRESMALSSPAYPLPSQLLAMDALLQARVDDALANNFDLQLAEQQLALAEQGVTLADKQRNSDPSLGVYVGKEGDENMWGVDLSLPLKFFNTDKPAYQQAMADSDAQRALLEKTRNDIRARLQGALDNAQQQQQRWQGWQQLAATSLDDNDALLKRVWQQGELTTQSYLLALNQSLDTRLSGIALREASQQAWIEWLQQSAQLDDWLNSLAN